MAGAITPVPGGVGPMTIAMLMRNTVDVGGKFIRGELVVEAVAEVDGRCGGGRAMSLSRAICGNLVVEAELEVNGTARCEGGARKGSMEGGREGGGRVGAMERPIGSSCHRRGTLLALMHTRRCAFFPPLQCGSQ